jgi:predicted Zn-dependent protease
VDRLHARGPTWRGTALLVVAAALLPLAARTWARNALYHDDFTLTQHDARAMPGCAKLQATAGAQLDERGDEAGAEAAFRRALAIYPDYPTIQVLLGKLLLRKGALDEALVHLRLAREQDPREFYTYDALAPVLELAGRPEEALEAYAAGARLYAGDFGFRFNHGRLLLSLDRVEEARAVLEALARDDSGGAAGSLARALLHETDGALDRAVAVYAELLGRPDLPPHVRANVENRLAALAGRGR